MFKASELKLISQNGREYDFVGHVQPNFIATNNGTLPIQPGDIIERKNKSNGLLERYIVIEPGYYDTTLTIPGGGPNLGEGHFQMKVKRENAINTNTVNNGVAFYGNATFNGDTTVTNSVNIDSSIINSIEGIDENLKKEIISLLKECKKKDSPKLKEFIINQILPLPVKVAGEVLTAMILSKIGM